MKRKRKNWFTMVEVIVVLFIIATALIAIISGLSKTTRYISEMRQRTIALNLAKEGIEAVYNIRNTNWRKRSANKDACWLKTNPLVDEGNDGCESDQRIYKAHRALESTGTANTPYNFLEYHNPFLANSRNNRYWRWWTSIFQDLDTIEANQQLKLHFVNGEWISHKHLKALQDAGTPINETTAMGNYYRLIRVWGLFGKTAAQTNHELTCQNGLQDCGNSTPKELRFCSTVIYTRPHQGIVNICSIMTNFFE